MDFRDRVLQLTTQVSKQLPNIKTEEATKNALILPFIQVLGYDVFNLEEVTPEYIADVGIKKGEKVDYAIMYDGKPCMLFECKMTNADLESAHFSQLYRYFSVTEARFGILTNGTEYRFFTDLDKPNRMDEKPFLIFDVLDPKDTLIEELKKFAKGAFDVEVILSTATQLKYTNEIKRIFAKQLTEPDEDFIRFFAKQLHPGMFSSTIREQFTTFTKLGFRQFINEQITDRLTTALKSEETAAPEVAESEPNGGQPVIVTSDDERDAYLIIRAILREVVDVKRVVMRDTQSYCGILLDDNNRKPIARLHFNSGKKHLGVFDANKQEERISISTIDDIYRHADRIKASVSFYDVPSADPN
ncbi:MAG: type I restriction enzyme HsdR N-terminal domain-containing protein [Acidobacteriales bacterium]|nr:type I restriction enzyme HsdR N-terminal domain-containing protein [Terriglobales bacterium]